MEPVRVKVELGYKRNMGNFETLNMNFSVSDSARAGETADQAFERVYHFVEGKLVDKIDELTEKVD